MIKKPFVLSGGGARGFAHLGVVKALQEQNIYPSAISGASSGAIAGAFLANGFTPDETIEILAGKLSRRMLTWNSLRRGLVSFKKMLAYIEQNLRYQTFEELPMPLYITATSFIDGRQKIFNKGSITEALAASCAIPTIFPVVKIDSTPYVDGGLSNNLPIEPFLRHKKEAICIHVNPIRDLSEKVGFWEIVERAFHLSFVSMVRQSAQDCYLFIEPKDLIHYNLFDLNKSNEIISIGYDYGKAFLLENAHLINEESFMQRFKMNIQKLMRRN